MRKILGLDLGTTSIGWAFIKESEDDSSSEIVKLGVRVNPLTIDEQTNFEKGKSTSISAERTLKRGARRNLQRYKLRRENLISVMKENKWIDHDSVLTEVNADSTHSTFALRAKAVTEKISLGELARVLLMINKKRGYKSIRKAKNEEEGSIIDGMEVAKQLSEKKLTPGAFCLDLLKKEKKYLPDFYPSDLKNELDAIWEFQEKYHEDILTSKFREEIEGKGKTVTSAIFYNTYQISTAENKKTKDKKKKVKDEQKIQAYQWRVDALTKSLTKEELAYVIVEINNDIKQSSGYLGAISDRSKELYFNKLTVGQYLYNQLKKDPHTRMKNQVFYRKDYLDEFKTLWKTQAKLHTALTPELETKIRNIIFYQRKLKSQKGLVSICEFENKTIEVEKDGKKIMKTVGSKVAPKSSPLFQEFKIWQILHNIKIVDKETGEELVFDTPCKEQIFEELNVKGTLKKEEVFKAIGYKPKDWEMNFKSIEGNRTVAALYDAYFKMMETEGHDEIDWINRPAKEVKEIISSFFGSQNIDKEILEFNPELEGKKLEQQKSYQLWHLLYSYEGDDSTSGNERLYELLKDKFNFKREFAVTLANVTLQDGYGNLSTKAIRKIFPYIQDNGYAEACKLAGYDHSSSVTKEENETRTLKDRLELLPKNSLRNPVVEKILNQMVNVVNAIIDDPSMGKPDEIRIELARELKKSAEERKEMTANMEAANKRHAKIRETLMDEFNIKNPSRNDIIRYKLYEELETTGYKSLYTNAYISQEKLFSKDYDIEHIIPKALLFDDSFSNKTICERQVNLDKGNKTAYDYFDYLGDEKRNAFIQRVENAHEKKTISKAKYHKLLKKESDLGNNGFIARDLRESQYIAKEAKSMLLEICRHVVSTSGSITDKLREDWGLMHVMQEMNFDKYKEVGLTEWIEKKDGTQKERIKDWTKRNDHRHHAMDALVVAFTKHNHINYLNHLNARKNEHHKKHSTIFAIEKKETEVLVNDEKKRQRKFKMPLPDFRAKAKAHLENILVSYKAKNKVATKNKNKINTNRGEKVQTVWTPRGQLHKETVYGKIKTYKDKEEKVGGKFNKEKIQLVTKPSFKNALLQRLQENGNDPKKAFTGKNSLAKNPLYADENKTVKVPEKVKLSWLENTYTIRKNIEPGLFKGIFYKKLEEIYDEGVRRALKKRYEQVRDEVEQYNLSIEKDGDKKKKDVLKEAFGDLEKNPIWLNKEKKISIKRVTTDGVNNAEVLHTKKDHLGKEILDKTGNTIPSDFVSTGNNHHVAIYKDEKGDLQEKLVSFYEAVERVKQRLPIVDKHYREAEGWQFLFTMKKNEYFVFPNEKMGFDPNEVDLLDPRHSPRISPNLFRVQKIATKDYLFTHHTETKAIDRDTLKNKKALEGKTYWHIQTPKRLMGIIKVRINHIGNIVKVGEY